MDSKFSALIAYIIFCLKNGFDDMNEVMVLDNSTNDILLFSGVYDKENDVDLNTFWSGWLNKESIEVIEKL